MMGIVGRLVVVTASSLALLTSAACADQGEPRDKGHQSGTSSAYWERVDLDARPVTRVISGDKLAVDIDGDETTIKIIGIRAPDPNSPDSRQRCLARLSTDHLREILGGLDVSVRYEEGQPRTDGDGNTRAQLAAPLANGQSVGVEQVRSGWAARITDSKSYDDSMHSEMYLQTDAEEEARRNQAGIWNPGICN